MSGCQIRGGSSNAKPSYSIITCALVQPSRLVCARSYDLSYCSYFAPTLLACCFRSSSCLLLPSLWLHIYILFYSNSIDTRSARFLLTLAFRGSLNQESTMADSNNLLRPLPQRAWQITPNSTDPPSPIEEFPEQDKSSATLSASRTRSILNLTSSTLYGIYSPSDAEGARGDYSQGHTPWGTGAMTPSSPSSPAFVDDRRPPVIGAMERPELRKRLQHRRPTFASLLPLLTARTLLLFISGLAYAFVITHLHENRHLAPVKLEGFHAHSWTYYASWGILSAIVGNIAPLLDFVFEGKTEVEQIHQEKANGIATEPKKSQEVSNDSSDGVLRADWNPAVRGIGVFIGIAFAIVSIG